MLLMKKDDDGCKSEMSLYKSSQSAQSEGVGKSCLSDPYLLEGGPAGRNESSGYNEIDYIEDMLSDDTRSEIELHGIPLRRAQSSYDCDNAPRANGRPDNSERSDAQELLVDSDGLQGQEHVGREYVNTATDHSDEAGRAEGGESDEHSSKSIVDVNDVSSTNETDHEGEDVNGMDGASEDVTDQSPATSYDQSMESVENVESKGHSSKSTSQTTTKSPQSPLPENQPDAAKCSVSVHQMDLLGAVSQPGHTGAHGGMRQWKEEEERNEKENVQKQNEIFDEIERRLAAVKNMPLDSNAPQKTRRFYFDNAEALANIETCLRVNDLKLCTLYGKMCIKEGRGNYRSHWFQLKGSNLTYFDEKKHLVSPFHMPNEVGGDIMHPESNDYFLTRKTTLNIFASRVYLVNNRKKCLSFLRCRLLCNDEFPELFDITQDRIVNISKVARHYIVTVSTPDLANLRLHGLEFALENSGSYVFFKHEDPDTFVRWLMAISFRQGRHATEEDDDD